ncbi:MAG: TonB-dependent receptor [Steroidobacteraceae bacterium]|jgi:iron complex outermembrane receptor protein|nr:TonB-dependent receptor [Steroidobacteraceae bacterium]
MSEQVRSVGQPGVVALLVAGLGLCVAGVLDARASDERGESRATLREDGVETVVVSARLRREDSQAVPISLSALSAATLEAARIENLQQATQLVPSLNFSAPNPRNTAYTIRGLGSSVVAIAQANDGLEPGVGFYVDGVYRGRPASAAFDFLDLERVEVLRGPQGTLFGKNTTAGAISLTTWPASFERELRAELSAGNFGFHQARLVANAPLVDGRLAGRLSAALTRRDGLLDNVTTGLPDNDLDNAALRGELRWVPRDGMSLRLSGDYHSIDSRCCTQVFVRVGSTLRSPARQYPGLAAGLGYAPPSLDPYDRLTDIDAPLRVGSREGGASLLAEWTSGAVELTSITAWRAWDWRAANDRDFTGLEVQTLQGIPSRQQQYSQELRLASRAGARVDYVAGLYAFSQAIEGRPTTAYGRLATYWLLGPAPAFPADLLDGYRSDGRTRFVGDSYAAFGEANWRIGERLSLTAGARYTYEEKRGRFESSVSGGLPPTTSALRDARLSILRPQSYAAAVDEGSLSGRLVAAWRWSERALGYASLARGSKSGGINMSGLPLDAANQPALSTAVVDPEEQTTAELGLKTTTMDRRLQLNLAAFATRVDDLQANVVDTGPGALRGYLANVERVEVRGLELDLAFAPSAAFSAQFAAAWTRGRYAAYRNGPCPLEAIGPGTVACDLGGRPLPMLPDWALGVGAEWHRPAAWWSRRGAEWFVRLDGALRGAVYGDASISRYTRIDGYGVLNASAGLRGAGPWDLLLWARNLLDEDYLQNVTVQAGNSGLVVGTPGDPAAFGLTLRARF